MKLVGLAELAQVFGVSKQVVANWRQRKVAFPEPVANLKSGPVWNLDQVAAWAHLESIVMAAPEETPGDGEEGSVHNALVAAVMNMKGGVGKSTLTANVGWYAGYVKNKRVLLVDLDPQFNLSQYILGVRGYEKLLADKSPTIDALFANEKEPVEISSIIQEVHEWDDGSCLHLLPADLNLAWSVRYAPDKPHVLRDNLKDIKDTYDLIIIDCAPTESTLSTAAYLAADYIFVPVKPEFLSTIGLPLLLQSLKRFKGGYKTEKMPMFGGVIFNDTGEKVEHDRSRSFVNETAKKNGLTVFKNEISHSDSYPTGARVGKPIFMTDNARSWKKEEFNLVAAEFLERMGL